MPRLVIWVQRYIKNMNHTSLCDTSLCDTSLFYVLLTRSISIVTTRHPCLLYEHHSLCKQAIQCHMNSKCCVQLCGFTSHAAKLFCLFLRGDGMTVFRLHPHHVHNDSVPLQRNHGMPRQSSCSHLLSFSLLIWRVMTLWQLIFHFYLYWFALFLLCFVSLWGYFVFISDQKSLKIL